MSGFIIYSITLKYSDFVTNSSYISPMDLSPVWLSLQLATVTTALLFLLSLPLAWWLATTRFKAKGIVDALVSIPLILPPSVLGFYLLIVFSPTSSIGGFFSDTIGIPLAFSFTGMVLASMIYSLPFMVYPLRSGLANLPPSYREAAATLGKSSWQTLIYVLLPNIRPQILVALAMTFAHTMGEFGVLVMISGNIPGETRVASVAVWEEMEALNYAGAHTYAAILLGVSIAVLLFLFLFNRKWLTLK